MMTSHDALAYADFITSCFASISVCFFLLLLLHFCFAFLKQSSYVGQANFEFISLPQLLEDWDYGKCSFLMKLVLGI